MDWGAILNYLVTSRPRIESEFIGVPDHLIRECEEGLGVTLPTTYVEFLRTMGVRSSIFRPFGPMDHNFFELIEDLLPEDYPGDRYFKVAIERDERRIPLYDVFLELNGSEQLVMFEDGGGFSDDCVEPIFLSLREELASAAWETIELSGDSKTRVLYVHRQEDIELSEAFSGVLDMLGRSHVTPVLGVSGNLAILSRNDLMCRAAMKTDLELIRIDLAGCSETALDQMIAVLLENIPGAEVDPEFKEL